MRYMGGKYKIAKYILEAIMEDTKERSLWFEPFVGGGNVLERATLHFDRSIAMDAHEDLMIMWQAVNAGWEPPPFVSREEYQELRYAEPSALRGFAGFGASYGGIWFRSYGVSKVDKHHPTAEVCRASAKVVTRQGQVFRKSRVEFIRGDFGSYTPPPRTVVYCDPPYENTAGYPSIPFDRQKYYETLVNWADRGCFVYASEYTVPIDIPSTLIWTQKKRSLMAPKSNTRLVNENLYRIG